MVHLYFQIQSILNNSFEKFNESLEAVSAWWLNHRFENNVFNWNILPR